MEYDEYILQKQKYFEKTLSNDAIYCTYLRTLDGSVYFSTYLWLQLLPFDLTQLGMIMLSSILPIDFEPLPIDFEVSLPSFEELLQGIWMNFESIDWLKFGLEIGVDYSWLYDFEKFIKFNFESEYWDDLIYGRLGKAVYGVTPWGRGYYDPVVTRDFIRSTFYKLRLLRTPNISWKKILEQLIKDFNMTPHLADVIYNRLMAILSAQTNSFILGLGVLGYSKLSKKVNDWVVVPIEDIEGHKYDLKFTTLDQLQMGFILGITPLGYGLLLPKKSIYHLPEGKKSPPAIRFVADKIKRISHKLVYLTWAYSNYNRVDEMRDFHKSERTFQYDSLQMQRRVIERWVAGQIPPEEANPVKIRQYQNAVLQAISWRAKRHKWGFEVWRTMTEKEFKGWWKDYWKGEGLNPTLLDILYTGMEVWLKRIREEKVNLGKRVKEIRRRLASLM